jgi:hypothetical protein
MFLKVSLFLIPDFYIWKNALDREKLDEKIAEFDTERGKYGFKKLPVKYRNAVIKQFVTTYGLKIAFKSEITFELYKQGRTQKWLHRCVLEHGYSMQYIVFSKMINGGLKMDKLLRELIFSLLNLY